MGGQAFLLGKQADVAGHGLEALRAERKHAGTVQKIVRRQAAGKTGSATGGQDMRRPGRIIPQSDGRVRPDENSAGVVDLG